LCSKSYENILVMKFDYATFFYKTFLLILISAQLYSIYFQVINLYTILINILLSAYLIFKYYLLQNLNVKAKNLSLTLPEFLIKRGEKCDDFCKKCNNVKLK